MKKFLLSVFLFLPLFTLAAENTHNPNQIKKEIKKVFDDKIMLEVARCESTFRQFTDSGKVLKGGTDNEMIGIFQVYGDIHKDKARSMGMDINTVKGNIKYAKYLYDKEGTSPWISSMPCWNPVSKHEGNGESFWLGMFDPKIKKIQKLLNDSGFEVSKSGPGSSGNETSLFGALTRTAVRNFQCSEKIVCEGDEYTTGYGVVGPRTLKALTNYSKKEIASLIKELEEKIAAIKKQIAEYENNS